MIFIATRSFIEPAGFRNSSLAHTLCGMPAVILCRRTSGVFPTHSRIDSWTPFMTFPGEEGEDRAFIARSAALGNNPHSRAFALYSGRGGPVDEVRFRLLRRGDYIFGSFLKPESVDGYINGVNPGDKADVLGRFPFSESSVDEAVEYANIGAKTWRRASLNDRANALRRFREHIARFQERLASLITRETGKPIWEARHEVIATVRALDLFL